MQRNSATLLRWLLRWTRAFLSTSNAWCVCTLNAVHSACSRPEGSVQRQPQAMRVCGLPPYLQTHSRARASQYGQTALSWAANNGHVAVVQLLLERRADVHAKSTRVRPAVRLPRSAALLLTSSLRRATQGGNTPLHLAAHRGHAECARLLINSGADLNAKNDVRSRCLARSCVTAVTAA
jgi:hypothetical protein